MVSLLTKHYPEHVIEVFMLIERKTSLVEFKTILIIVHGVTPNDGQYLIRSQISSISLPYNRNLAEMTICTITKEYFSLLSVLSKGKGYMTEQAPLSGFTAVDMMQFSFLKT